MRNSTGRAAGGVVREQMDLPKKLFRARIRGAQKCVWTLAAALHITTELPIEGKSSEGEQHG